MLDALRSAAGTWVAKLLLLLLVMSFAVWGISGSMLGGVGGNTVVSAGETNVSVQDYRLAYDRQVSVMSQQFGQRLTREQATAFGIDNQVLGQLIAGAVLDEQARLMRLGVSRDRLAVLTTEDPAFHGPDGRFDRRQFDYVLRQVGMRPDDYITNREQVAVRQQIVEAVSDGMTAPDTFLRAVSLYQGEDRTVDYLVVPASSLPAIEEPGEDALKTYFEANKATYAAPEFREIKYVKLDPAALADPTSVTDEQVKQDYDRTIARHTTPETRTIDQLSFPDEVAAKTALDAIRAGGSFDHAVTAAGKTAADVRLGSYAKSAIPDQALAEAAFALPDGGVSDVVAGSFGPVLLRVGGIKPAVVRPIEEVRDQIRQDLATADAARILLDVHDQYEDARAGGDTLQEAADKGKLKVVTVPAIDRQARDPDGTVIADIPESAALLRDAFDSEPQVENPAIPIGSNGYVFFEVEKITPARDRTLEEVRGRVVADWKAAETAKRLADRTAELKKRAEDGATLDQISTELSLTKSTKRGVKRQAEDADFGEAGVAAVFAVPQNGVGAFATPSGDGQTLFRVVEAVEPVGAGPETLPEEARANFSRGMADDLLDQLVARLQGEFAVTVNREAITRALSF